MNKIRLLIVYDHLAFGNGLCRILEDEEDFKCVDQAENGVEAISLAKNKASCNING